MLLRHAQPRKPKNEALLYSFIANEEVRYSRGVRTSFVARVSHEAISEVEPLSTDI